eukprot:m.281298 g.281298  ORF g.281298 m.281298 type:complete len:93 (+) comp19836_c0_seq6:234-512(+)
MYKEAFMVTDAIVKAETAGGIPAFHWVISQYFAKITSVKALEHVVAGDDAADVRWFTQAEIRRVEQEQKYGQVAHVVQRALALSAAGMLPLP